MCTDAGSRRRRSATRSSAGDLEWPRIALGRRFVLDGEVVSGHGRGKGLGFPTANLQTWPRLLLPGQGIYAGVAELAGRRYRAAIDVGTNPTFGTEPLHAEAFLLDYDGDDLRGEPLALEFWERLRDEVRYDSVDELVAAIADDVERTRELVPAAEPAGERPPRAQAARAALGVRRCDRAGRGRDDGGVGHDRRPRGTGASSSPSLSPSDAGKTIASPSPSPALPPSRRARS